MANTTDAAAVGFHFDKRIPIALIFALIIQTAGIFYWIGQQSITIENQGLEISSLKAEITQMRTVNDRLVRLEVQLEQVLDQLRRL